MPISMRGGAESYQSVNRLYIVDLKGCQLACVAEQNEANQQTGLTSKRR